MKRFFFTVLALTVFFLGVGAIVERTQAMFRSDERALDLIKKARLALGGDSAIDAVQSMTIVGRTTRVIKVNGVDRTDIGETEIAMQLPDRLSKMVKIGNDKGEGDGQRTVDKQVDVVVVADKDTKSGVLDGKAESAGKSHKIVIKKDDGTIQELTGAEAEKVIAANGKGGRTWSTADGKTISIDEKHVAAKGDPSRHHSAMRSNEMLRLTLGLLLASPQGINVDYTFGGEASLDGIACNVVIASFGAHSYKLYLDRGSNLPVGMVYRAAKMPAMIRFNKDVPAPTDNAKKDVLIVKSVAGEHAEMVDFQVRFSDYRSVNGVQLPFKWTQTVAGVTDETFDVTGYEINPANIAEKFKDQKVWVRKSQENK